MDESTSNWLERRDMFRRWVGAVLLILSLAMLILGQTVLQRRLQGLTFLLYWMACFLFTIAALVLAFLDIRAVRRRLYHEQKQLIEKTIEEAQAQHPPERNGADS